MAWLKNPNGSWATYNGTWVVVSADNSCCCGNVVCDCSNYTPFLKLRATWTDPAAFDPPCTQTAEIIDLAETDPVPAGLGIVAERYWSGSLTNCTTDLIEVVCSPGLSGTEFYYRINGAAWFILVADPSPGTDPDGCGCHWWSEFGASGMSASATCCGVPYIQVWKTNCSAPGLVNGGS